MMSMGNVLVAAEAFALGVAAGVEPDKLYDVLSVSGGRSHHFTKRFPNAIKGDFSPGFKMELGEKDLALAVELGRMTRMPTPSASATRELYALALAEGFRGQDIVALLAMYQNWAKPQAELIDERFSAAGSVNGPAGDLFLPHLPQPRLGYLADTGARKILQHIDLTRNLEVRQHALAGGDHP